MNISPHQQEDLPPPLPIIPDEEILDSIHSRMQMCLEEILTVVQSEEEKERD